MALCTPNEALAALQNAGNFTELMVMQEEAKMLPFGAVWAEYCTRAGVAADASWFEEVKAYERDVLSKR